MKYAEIIIHVHSSNIDGRKNIEIRIPRMNKDAPFVGLLLRKRENVSCYNEEFSISNTYSRCVGLTNYLLMLPVCQTEDINRQANSSMININASTTTGLDMMNKSFNLVMWKLIMSLYHWDKRCQRSVKVKSKETVDIPLKIIMGGSTIEVVLEQMKTFAEFIKNK